MLTPTLPPPCVLAPISALPKYPPRRSFFNTILIMPAVPSGLYFAEGFVITSMRSIVSPGICSRIWARFSAVSPDSLPLIHTVTDELPRSDTSPSWSTSTDGIDSKSSLADAPADAMSASTVKTRRSSSKRI